jgi:peptidoglycan LD-endopeptidase CwlK
VNLDLMIREVQARLGCTADGKAGPQTWAAIHGHIFGTSRALPAVGVDARSATNIATLHAKVQDYARALIQAAAQQAISIKVISGTRTYEQQNALYAQGRTKPGVVVTNARAGYSNHNFGIAFDIGVFDARGSYLEESPLYKVVGSLGVGLGLEWGGNWKRIEDQPHFHLRPQWAAKMTESRMLAELRFRQGIGKDVFA